jgi:lipocalin
MILKLFATFTLLALHGVSSQQHALQEAPEDYSSRILQWGGSDNCPPDDFDSRDSFDLTSFISERWYNIKQKVTRYQPEGLFHCIYTEFDLFSSFCFFCGNKRRISVFNRALRDNVDGREFSVNFGAIVPRPNNEPARFFVGPRFLPFWLIPLTNYWVVAAGTYADVVAGDESTGTDYEWAIVTAGPPNQEGDNDLCYSSAGMWILARDPEPSSLQIAAIEAKAVSLGLDIGKMRKVEQAGCDYDA